MLVGERGKYTRAGSVNSQAWTAGSGVALVLAAVAIAAGVGAGILVSARIDCQYK